MDRGVQESFGGGGGGGKRKIDDEIELAKQKAQAIAARLLNDADSKRPRTLDSSPLPDFSSSYPSSHSSFPVPYATQTSQYNGVPSSKKIQIPNAKVGVIIGRGGEMIKNLQQRSGARIQITRDADADRTSLTRDVELVGTQEQINRVEELINEVIAETDAASSGSSGNRVVAPLLPGSEQFVMKVPNDRVALVIGKGGETIKTMQSKSGARIQVVPLHLPPGDTSTERNIYINGTKEQIDSAKELINEVISGNRLKVMSGTSNYTQPSYSPSTGWAPQGQTPPQQPPAYGYSQPGTYAMPPPPYYGGYPSQPTGWEQVQQQSTSAAGPPQQHNTAYNAYGQQSQPSSTQPNANYNYSQMPPTTTDYNQGYPQQPSYYGQDISGHGSTPDQGKPYANPSYGPPATSTQPDGTPAVGMAQARSPSAYGPGYNQPTTAPPNGYGAHPSYSSPATTVQPAYNQSGYSQMGYGQQQEGQVSNQASYSYYGQSGYPPAQAGYYQGAYVPPQTQPQATNGGDSTKGSGGGGAEESEKPKS